MPDRACAVILAAGASTRLGQAKQLLQLKGESLIRRSARIAIEADCSPVIAVLGYRAEQVANEFQDLDVQLAINPVWQQGMGTSLACGIARAGQRADALVMVCDQVKLEAANLAALLARHRASGAPLTVSSYAGRLGVPAVFSREIYPKLLALTGDQGARGVIECQRDRAAVVSFPEGVEDIDEAADWERLTAY